MRIFTSILLFSFAVILAGPSPKATAGFLDAFNNASRAIQQTTGTIENTQNTIERAGNVIHKNQKPPAAQVEKNIQQTAGMLADKDRSLIAKAQRAWIAAFKAEDWDALVDQYAENAVIMPPDEEATSGHEAIRANFETDEDTSNEVFKTVQLDGNGNLAYVEGAFSFTIKSKSDSTPPVKASGKYIEIWQKQEDGTWLITHDIWNADPAVQ